MSKKDFKKYLGSESDFQKTVARLLDSYGFIWFHSPNEIKAAPQYLKKRKAWGVKSGVPDCLILTPNKTYKGLAIELKVGYNKPSTNQINWLASLQKLGYYCLVSHSLEEVEEVVRLYKKDLLK